MPLGLKRSRLVYVAGQLAFTGATFLFNLIAARQLGPKSIGIWQTIMVVANFGIAFSLGIASGMGREVPYFVGKALPSDARAAVASTAAALIGLLLLLLALSALANLAIPREHAFVFSLAMAMVGVRIWNNFSVIVLRSYRDLTRLACHQAGSAALLVAGMVALTFSPTLGGVFLSVFVALLSVTVLSFKYLSFLTASVAMVRRLVRIGLPMLGIGMLFLLLGSVDRVIILTFLGTEALGLYTPAILILGVMTMIPALVSNVMYPRLAEEYGRSDDIRALLPLVRTMMRVNIGSAFSIAIVFFLMFHFFLIPSFLPDYLPGRTAMGIIVIAALVLPIGQSFGDFYNVIGLQRIFLRNVFLGSVVNVLVGVVLTGVLGMGLSGVATGTVLGFGVFSLLQFLVYKNVLADLRKPGQEPESASAA